MYLLLTLSDYLKKCLLILIVACFYLINLQATVTTIPVTPAPSEAISLNAAIIYVDSSATGNNDGTSWTHAFTNLQEGIDSACACNGMVYVAKGIYIPQKDKDAGGSGTLDRNNTFYINCNIKIYGGFPSGGSTFPNRNPSQNPTILSGDLGKDDDPNLTVKQLISHATRSDNAYTVVHLYNVDNTFLLEGFHITGGHATSNQNASNIGGGIYIDGIEEMTTMPVINQCLFYKNYAQSGGAIGYPTNGIISNDVRIDNCIFYDNDGTTGSAITLSNLTITNSTFFNNGANSSQGGAISHTALTATNCLFYKNSSNTGGALYKVSGTLNNCTFYGNIATYEDGGAVYDGSFTANNCIFWGNKALNITNAPNPQKEIRSFSPSITLKNCIIDDEMEDGTVDFPVNVTNGGNNLDLDPVFIDTDGADNISGTMDDNYQLQECSAAIDKGLNAANTTTEDLAGNMRKIDATMNGSSIIDIGAYEFQQTVNPCTEIMLSSNSFNINNGSDSVSTSIANGTNFSGLDAGSSNMKSIIYAIKNTGDAALLLNGTPKVQLSGDLSDFSITNQATASTLNNGDSTNFTIQFAPTSAGLKYATVSIANNDSNENPFEFVIRGRGCPSVIYVDSSATGTKDGLSWTNAFTDLQDAIDLSCECSNSQIWVAKGNYYPTKDKNGGANPNEQQNKTFYIACNIEIYAGFAGTESNLSERNFHQNITVLNGDLNKNDTEENDINHSNYPSGNTFDNVYTVLYTKGVDSTLILDGFHIKNGNAQGHNFEEDTKGGGWFNDGTGTTSGPKIKNCTFHRNIASQNGGAIYNKDSAPTFENCRFYANFTQNNGGAIYSTNGLPTLKNCILNGNKSNNRGAAIYNESAATESTNCVFSGNRASSFGGAIYNQNANSKTISCSFYSNQGSSGGAIYNSNSNPAIINSIFWNNRRNSTNNIAGADIFGGSPMISYCLTQENSSFSTGTGIINNQNPLFSDADGSDNTVGTLDDLLSLESNSPLIDMGLDSVNQCATDLANNPRKVAIAANMNQIDMGAYELQSSSSCQATLAVNGQISSGTYAAINSITSTGVISSGNTVTFKAGQSINLTAGFQVAAGAQFTAMIEACQNLIASQIPMVQNQLAPHSKNKLIEKELILSVYPNPFHHQTQLEYYLPKKDFISIQLFNQMGQLVKQLTPLQNREAGWHQFSLNKANLKGNIYFIRLQSTDNQIIKKIIMLQD